MLIMTPEEIIIQHCSVEELIVNCINELLFEAYQGLKKLDFISVNFQQIEHRVYDRYKGNPLIAKVFDNELKAVCSLYRQKGWRVDSSHGFPSQNTISYEFD
jgi:hypothetical protein